MIAGKTAGEGVVFAMGSTHLIAQDSAETSGSSDGATASRKPWEQ